MPRKAVVTSPIVTQGLGRVLVVDDDEVIRQLIAVNLQLEGFEVATAVDGQDCLDNVQVIAPDVITLDVIEAVLAVHRRRHLEALELEVHRDELPDHLVVVNNEHPPQTLRHTR